MSLVGGQGQVDSGGECVREVVQPESGLVAEHRLLP